MAAQLAKLNEACISLSNMSMGVTDIQFCLILLNALPASYEVVASTILASGAPSALSHTEIIARIINEEGRCATNPSLNVARATPIKSGKKKEHAGLTCHYCQKKGHIKPNCQKKKWDEAEKGRRRKGLLLVEANWLIAMFS
jgi:gag-polypeptide of LTR copia-type